MKKSKKSEFRALQTRVSEEVAEWVEQSAKADAIGTAAWLRRLILAEQKKSTGFV